MNSPKKPKSLQEILKQRQQITFVGREPQIAIFRQNMGRSPELRDYFIFNVWGQGGVGKSTLLRQFRKIADEAEFATALTSDSETSIPEAMGRLAGELEQAGQKLTQFSDRYKLYRQKKQELESDPDAPQGFSAFLGKSIAKAGLGLAKQVPGSGAVTPFIDEDAFTSQAGEWASYVARKLGNKDEVQLVNEPVEVLTPLFVQELSHLAEKANLVLFFDTYERTSPFLDSWLRELLEGRHGDLPANVMLVIAGRDELDKNHWADYENFIARFPLNPFTDEEAIQYLHRKGITNDQIIEVILHLSGRLPLLVTTLAATSPNDPSQIGDPSETAVERFLQWIDDPKKRQVAIDASLPRLLNRDIIAVLQGEETADDLFHWLKSMPFVEQRPDGWAYHDIARTQMLRYKRRTSPQSWADFHGKLADYYDIQRANLQLDEKTQWIDVTWQTYSLNSLYHDLCKAPQAQLPKALNEFLAVLQHQDSFAQELSQYMSRAGHDAGNDEVKAWGEKLLGGLMSCNEKRYESAVEVFASLLNYSGIEMRLRPVALNRCGDIYYFTNRYSEALEKYAEAVELAPAEALYWINRGCCYRALERTKEALHKSLNDLNHAIKLDQDNAKAFSQRGITYRLMERYEESLQDCNRSIELDPNNALMLVRRGLTYRLMEYYEEALKDFNQAIELDPNDTWAYVQRGRTYHVIKRYEEALQNYDRAIECNSYGSSELATAFAQRGKTYWKLDKYQKSIEDFNQAISNNPQDDWAFRNRGKTYQDMQSYEKALKDFSKALELNSTPTGVPAYGMRGETFQLLGYYEKALEDFNRAIDLDPKYAGAIRKRGEIYLILRRNSEALADFDLAVKLKPDNDVNLYVRALAYKVLNQLDNAKSDFDKAIELAQQRYNEKPDDHQNTFNLAIYHLAADNLDQSKHFYRDALNRGASVERIREAIRDLEDFLRVFPGHEVAQCFKQGLEKRVNGSMGKQVGE